jgi:hypothetical protein
VLVCVYMSVWMSMLEILDTLSGHYRLKLLIINELI